MNRIILLIILLMTSFELSSAGRTEVNQWRVSVTGTSGLLWYFKWTRWTDFEEGAPVHVKEMMMNRFIRAGHLHKFQKELKSIMVPVREPVSESFYLSALFL